MPNYFAHSLLRARDWQHRPQLDAVCDWWRGIGGMQGGRGVCALIGMGGAGKTAVAERFLRRLPGGLPVDPQVDKDSSLPTPHSTFVFSFYDAPNADAFFEALQIWLEGTPRIETILSIGQMGFLLQQRQGLIVMDGLERVQHDGQRGDFGRLHSPKLRDFLNQLASGMYAELSVLVTSRFPLADLRDKNRAFFHPIPVNQIDIATGVQLLRDRGVRGTDLQLEPIVQQCGRHALTVDFAGGYIAEYGQGDPATPLELSVGVQPLGASGNEERLKPGLQHEDELDEDQREVLRQGYRFARIAEHYRDAMLQKDEAAMALLERICLFRLGVDSETLTAIFTGEQAVEVSGQALAALNAEQLQSKLDWLVRMRIVECGVRIEESGTEGNQSAIRNPQSETPIYTIHPAVRDGFLSGIRSEDRNLGHEAVRKGLEVSLGDVPGENPSDPATLDLLEEVVHHTLQSGHVREAWDIYWNRIGGYKNLGWRLGAYERGERICRAFVGGQSPEGLVAELKRSGASRPVEATSDLDSPEGLRPFATTSSPFLDLPEVTQTSVIANWAIYLQNLGRLPAAARCYELVIEMRMRQENWENASIGNRNLCDVWLLSGRLQKDEGGRMKDEKDGSSLHPASCRPHPYDASSAGALATADEALRLAELADEATGQRNSYSFRARANSIQGHIAYSMDDFRESRSWQNKRDKDDRPLYAFYGIWHSQMLARLGRHEEATRLTEANQEICEGFLGGNETVTARCQLVLSTLSLDRSDSPTSDAESSADLWTQARDWALARDAKEVLCWSYLVECRMWIAECGMSDDADKDSAFRNLQSALDNGLKIARDCGYGLYHIDLLLERVRLYLLRGDAQAALADIEMALGDETGGGGIPANEATGQPELLAARHGACGYAWAIPAALQLRAEALLLQAAREVISVGWASPTDAGTLHPVNVDAVGDAHPTIGQLINQAKQLLHEALDLWQPLHDPEPERDDQNFKLDGKEYNYKAAETYAVLKKLGEGTLTSYPLEPKDHEMKDFFVSYNGNDKAWAEWIAWILEEAGYSVVIQAWDFRPGDNFVLKMQEATKDCEKTIAVLSQNYLDALFTQPEWAAAFVDDPTGTGRKLVPVRIAKCDVEGLLKAIVYVDLVGVSEDDARSALLGAFSGRAKPATAPTFPGATTPAPPRVAPTQKTYPAATSAGTASTSTASTILAASMPAGTTSNTSPISPQTGWR